MNCHLDHVHCLISLGIDQNISKVVSLIKGESSHWINQEKLVPGKFAWQDEYFAVAVSESNVRRVQEYIRNQELHHKNKSPPHLLTSSPPQRCYVDFLHFSR